MTEPRNIVEAVNACSQAIEKAHAELVKLVEAKAREINDIWRKRGAQTTGTEHES